MHCCASVRSRDAFVSRAEADQRCSGSCDRLVTVRLSVPTNLVTTTITTTSTGCKTKTTTADGNPPQVDNSCAGSGSGSSSGASLNSLASSLSASSSAGSVLSQSLSDGLSGSSSLSRYAMQSRLAEPVFACHTTVLIIEVILIARFARPCLVPSGSSDFASSLGRSSLSGPGSDAVAVPEVTLDGSKPQRIAVKTPDGQKVTLQIGPIRDVRICMLRVIAGAFIYGMQNA